MGYDAWIRYDARMTDRTPTGDQQDTTVDGDRTDRTRQDAMVAPTVTVPEAARILGVSTDAVRSRLRRGTLEGVKIAGEWHVPLSGLHDTRQDAQPSPPGPRQEPSETQQDATVDQQAGQQESDRIATVMDVAPLASLIDDLTRRNADLAATAAMWQTRAAHLEDQLKQLSAGEIVPEPPGSTETNATGPRGVWHRLRRLWSG
jgi:hypothetical protein